MAQLDTQSIRGRTVWQNSLETQCVIPFQPRRRDGAKGVTNHVWPASRQQAYDEQTGPCDEEIRFTPCLSVAFTDFCRLSENSPVMISVKMLIARLITVFLCSYFYVIVIFGS